MQWYALVVFVGIAVMLFHSFSKMKKRRKIIARLNQ